jgi:membrane protease YdiL (CAAX protease family)
MSKQARSYFQRPQPYWRRTQRPLNSLLWLLPMLAVFHLGNLWWRTNLLAWWDINRALAYVGVSASWLPAVVLVVLLLIQHIMRRDPWTFPGGTLLGMVFESLAGAVPLVALTVLTEKMWPHQAGATELTPGQMIVSGVGAGVYEEFVFRMLFIGFLLLVFTDLLGLDKAVVGTVAVLASAAVFSLYHFDLQRIEPGAFPWKDFVFRALAGTYLGVVFLTRGLGVAAGAHAFYNIYVTLAGGGK